MRRGGLLAAGAFVVIAGGMAVANLRPATGAEEAASLPGGVETAGIVETVVQPPTSEQAAAADDTASVPVDTAPAVVREPVPPRTPVAASERVPKPEHVRGLYLNAYAAGSTRKLAKLIDIASRTEINSFVVDVKEAGTVSYRSSVAEVAAIGADRNYVRDMRGVLAQLKANGIYPIARIVAFKDDVLAAAKPEWAVKTQDGEVWRDAAGFAWVDSFNRHVWDYNIAIAREAIEMGFSEVQWDYVRFPDVPRSLMRTAVWPAREGRTKEDGIREFLLYSREQLADLDVPITADIFGLTVSAGDDMGIGQLWEKLIDATDALLPMVYPSHFARGSYGIPIPNAAPYRTVKTAMEWAQKRTRNVENPAIIRPWLQDFTLGQPRYEAAHVRAQIQAVYDAGLSEWVLWHPGSNYTVEALADRAGVAPDYAIPDVTTLAPAVVKPQVDSVPPVKRDSVVPVRRDTLSMR
jgi:hypothetical protein